MQYTFYSKMKCFIDFFSFFFFLFFQNYEHFHKHLQLIVDHLTPILDISPDLLGKFLEAPSLWQKMKFIYQNPDVARAGT